MTRARFTDFAPEGNYIPGAPNMIVSAGVVFGKPVGLVRRREASPLRAAAARRGQQRALDADDAGERARGYRWENGVRLQLDAFNLFNVKANQIEYYYESRLASEPIGAAVPDRHLHPVEPLALRLTLAGPL